MTFPFLSICLKMAGVIGSLVFLGSPACSLVTRLSPRKTGGGESLVTSTVKAVDFRRLGLAVPIRLQNEITCSRNLFQRHCQCALHALNKHTHVCGVLYKLTTQDERANADYTPTVGKTQLSSVREGHRTEESSVTFYYGWFAGSATSSFIAARRISVVKDELSEFVCKKLSKKQRMHCDSRKKW